MKQAVFILLIFIVLQNSTAQRYDNARNLNLSLGTVNSGFLIGAGYENFFGRANSLQLDIDYSLKQLEVINSDKKASISNIIMSASFRQYLDLGSVFPYIGVGFFGGNETLSRDNVKPTVVITREDGFIYGVHPEVGMEINLNFIYASVSFAPRYDFRHDEFLSMLKITTKFYLKL